MSHSPFKLLEPYRAAEKDIFFGRDAEIYALFQLLKQTRLALVYGASGTGKTSLLHAGLPKVFKVADWLPVFIRRRDNINASFMAELARKETEATPGASLAQLVQNIYDQRRMPLYLVFDQFEEVFTLGDDDERKVFFTNIQQLLDENLPFKIILSMREEYIGHLYDYEPLVPSLFEKRFRLEAMKDTTVQEVTSRMCETHNITLEREQSDTATGEKSTTELILQQIKTSKQAAYLPYLQIYLHYLYEQALATTGKPHFTAEVIRAVGELGNVLKKFIETRISDAGQFGIPEDFARQLLDQFATSEGTRQGRRRPELMASLKKDEALVQKALNYFTDTAKLLRADEDDVERYELMHDVAAKQIHELRSAEEKEFKAFQQHLRLAYERWQADQQPNERLLPERDLSRVEFFQKRLEEEGEFQEKWRGFVDASKMHIVEINHKEQMRQKKLRRLNRWLIAITTVALAASITALIAYNIAGEERDKAKNAEARAIKNWHLALDAEKAAKTSADVARLETEKAVKAEEGAAEALKQRILAEKKATQERINKLLTEANSYRKEKRFEDALKTYREALTLESDRIVRKDIENQLSDTENEQVSHVFEQYKGIGLALKAANNCKAALIYLKKAKDTGIKDEAVEKAFEECSK